jgi:hypothetical protein
MNVSLCAGLVPILVLLSGCPSEPPSPADTIDPETLVVSRAPVAYGPITEASGLVASRKNPGLLWTHNDSGDANRLYLLTPEGEHRGVFFIEGASARDWEDIALGPGPDPERDYLYIGDIGDNRSEHDRIYVYRVPEPRLSPNRAPRDTTLTETTRLTLRYVDRPHNAETLLIDPVGRILYVVTKESAEETVFAAPFPLDSTAVITLEPVATAELSAPEDATFQIAVSGDISPSGLKLLIKSYDIVYLWTRTSAEASFFDAPPVRLPYIQEPQGEAIAWATDEAGYFTVSEEPAEVPAVLYHYLLPEKGDQRDD